MRIVCIILVCFTYCILFSQTGFADDMGAEIKCGLGDCVNDDPNVLATWECCTVYDSDSNCITWVTLLEDDGTTPAQYSCHDASYWCSHMNDDDIEACFRQVGKPSPIGIVSWPETIVPSTGTSLPTPVPSAWY